VILTITLSGCSSKPPATNYDYSKSQSNSNDTSNKNDTTGSDSNMQQNQTGQAPNSDTVVQAPEDNIVYINKPVGKITRGNVSCNVSLYGYSFKDGNFKAYMEFKNDSSASIELSGTDFIQGSVITVDNQVVQLVDWFKWQDQYIMYGLPAGTSHVHIFEASGLTNSPEKAEFIVGDPSPGNDWNEIELKGQQKNFKGVIFPATVTPNVNISKTFNQLGENQEASVNIGNFKDIDSAIVQKISYTPNGGEIQLVLKSSRYSAYPFTIDACSECDMSRIYNRSYLQFELITDQNEGIELNPEVSSDVLAKLSNNNQLAPNEQCILTLHFTTNLTKAADTAKIRIEYDSDYHHFGEWIKSDSEYFKLK